jgi:hypothetical protein
MMSFPWVTFKDGDVGIGVFREREEIFASGEKSVGTGLCSFAQY